MKSSIYTTAIVFLLLFQVCLAQDTLFLKNGQTLLGHIEHSNWFEILLKLDGEAESPSYRIKKLHVQSIGYESVYPASTTRFGSIPLKKAENRWGTYQLGVHHTDRDMDLLSIDPVYGFQFEYFGDFRHTGTAIRIDFGGTFQSMDHSSSYANNGSKFVRHDAASRALITLTQNFYLLKNYRMVRPFAHIGFGAGQWEIRSSYFGFEGTTFQPNALGNYHSEESDKHMWSHLSTGFGVKMKVSPAVAVSLSMEYMIVHANYDSKSLTYDEEQQTWSEEGRTIERSRTMDVLSIPLTISVAL